MRTEHQERMMASEVLKIHTNKNGLSGPSQLTRLKLKMRINTAIISMSLIRFIMKSFTWRVAVCF